MILQVEGSEAELHEIEGVKIYVVRNRPLEQMLFDRNLIGSDFRETCLESSRFFVRHLEDEFAAGDAAELIILSKGLVYQLSQAVSQELGFNLPTNLVATSRVDVSGDSAKISVAYSQMESPARTLLIGDTVASGGTIIEAIRTYLERHDLERLYVLSYAGAGIGAQRIARFCAENAIECTFLFGLGIFGLGDNGFDLSFLHPDTVASTKYKEDAHIQFSGKPASAVGWDFGSQAMAPEKYRHLCWIEAEVWGLQGAACFAVATKPPHLNDLMHERPAYARRYSGF
ncbi:hypothetical protein [Herbidospora sp. RD11066]